MSFYYVSEGAGSIEARTGMTTILGLPDERDTLKMLRETLATAQTALTTSPQAISSRTPEHVQRIDRIITEIDRQRPLAPDGKHGVLHTPTCGCEDR